MTRTSRPFVVAVLAAVLALGAVGCGDDSDADPSDPADPVVTVGESAEFDSVVELDVVDGELVGGSRQVDVGLGDRVQVVVTGDIEDQVHVHGYDLYIDPVDGEGELEFDAIIPGTFEIELEAAGRLLVRMTVS